MRKLRQMCLTSQRLKEVDYSAFKKEIGAVEIHQMGDYFLAILNKGIKVSNTPNSIVAYLIGITDDKPTKSIEYVGGTVPDIDIDNPRSARDYGKEYLKYKYGVKRVASIGTYVFMYAKGAIRNVGRALGKDLSLVNKLASYVPEIEQGRNWSTEEALNLSRELKEAYDTIPDAKEMLDYASTLNGVMFAKSKHAAGVVVAPEDISNIAPVRIDKEGNSVIEFDGNETEALGMLKIDLLGLKTLDIIALALKTINERHNLNILMSDIPLDDKKTYNILSSGYSLGIFQIEGDGISAICKSYKPQNVSDVSIISAMYRPGPIQFIPSILSIRKNQQPAIVSHADRFPILKPILEETYGFFVYQEQIQKVAQVLGGFDDSEADIFRKVISKKKTEQMKQQKEKFATGALKNGLTQKEIDMLLDEIEAFSSYCFNKSHSVSYSILTVYTAWLKANYPAEFYAANIAYEISSIDKVIQFIYEAKKFKVNIEAPDINSSLSEFVVLDDHTIKYGFSGIVGVGSTVAIPIIEERQKNGKFKSITNFIYRTNPKSNVLKNMAKAGCFDSVGTRAQLLYRKDESEETYLDELLAFVKHFKTKEWTTFSFDKEWIELPAIGEFDIEELMNMEREVTKIRFSSHPMILHAEVINSYKSRNTNSEIGILSEMKMFKNKNGFFFKLEGSSGKYLLFENQYKKLIKNINQDDLKDEMVVFKYRIMNQDEDTYAASDLGLFKNKTKELSIPINIRIPLNNTGIRILNKYKDIKDKLTVNHSQKYKVTLDCVSENYNRKIPIGYSAASITN